VYQIAVGIWEIGSPVHVPARFCGSPYPHNLASDVVLRQVGNRAQRSGWDKLVFKNAMDKYLKSQEIGKPRVFKVTSITEFIEVATWLYSNETVIFRGQRRDWPLVPAVGRDPGRSQCPWRERDILQEFKRESIPYLDLIPANDWQWLALAQHNRLPTRLLDWTTNPLAALWFAVKEPAVEPGPGLVWAYRYDEKEAIHSTAGKGDPFSISHIQVYFPEHVYRFIQAQAGVFTVHHKEGTNPGRFPLFEQCAENADLLLTKIEVPAEDFATIRYQLFRVGISPSTLFPGLSGIVERIRYDYMLCSDEKGFGNDEVIETR
jgi:hypothetical protein